MTGKEIMAIAMTCPATVPVIAPNINPTIMTEYPRPPLAVPNNCPIESSMSSANPHLSKIVPIRVKNGIASNKSFESMPNTLIGKLLKKLAGNQFI